MTTRVEEFLAKKAVQEALHLPINTEFVVSDLFSLAEWSLISYEAREFARAGGNFYDELKNRGLLDKYIIQLPDKINNATAYKRIGKSVFEALISDNT